jgi:hypothetical protein
MADGLDRDTELLEIHEISSWQQQVAAAAAGLFSAGPLGLLASLVAFRKLNGHWLPWALIGGLAAPPLAYGQWRAVTALQQMTDADPGLSGADLSAAQLITEADRLARACAEDQRDGSNSGMIRNPLDGRELLCDPSYPVTVVITSQPFAPLQQPRSCGSTTLSPGTRAAQWIVSPAGSLVCQAVAQNGGWWWEQASLNRQLLYRRCTENLRLEAESGFTRSAHQLGRPDYCAQERALLARDQITGQ